MYVHYLWDVSSKKVLLRTWFQLKYTRSPCGCKPRTPWHWTFCRGTPPCPQRKTSCAPRVTWREDSISRTRVRLWSSAICAKRNRGFILKQTVQIWISVGIVEKATFGNHVQHHSSTRIKKSYSHMDIHLKEKGIKQKLAKILERMKNGKFFQEGTQSAK